MKFTIKKNVNSFYYVLLIIWIDECYLKSAEKFTNFFYILLEKIVKFMIYQKNYASPKTCRYLRIVDNGIVLV